MLKDIDPGEELIARAYGIFLSNTKKCLLWTYSVDHCNCTLSLKLITGNTYGFKTAKSDMILVQL
jgi:hypothetical protein